MTECILTWEVNLVSYLLLLYFFSFKNIQLKNKYIEMLTFRYFLSYRNFVVFDNKNDILFPLAKYKVESFVLLFWVVLFEFWGFVFLLFFFNRNKYYTESGKPGPKGQIYQIFLMWGSQLFIFRISSVIICWQK